MQALHKSTGKHRNKKLREDVRKWKHETRKQENMHTGTAAGFKGTAQNPRQWQWNYLQQARADPNTFFLHSIFLRFSIP